MANTIVKYPKVGDILCLDENNIKKYIALDTFEALPAGWTAVGVVAHRQGNKAIVVHKTSSSRKWADVFRWYLTGNAMTDGAAHTENFTANSVSVPVTWQTSSLSAFAEALNSAIAGQDFGGHSYRALYDAAEDKVIVIHDTYITYISPTMSGVTFNRLIGEDTPMDVNIFGINGVGIEYKGLNWRKYYEYIKTATSSILNPTSPITSLGTYPLSYASYSSEIGAYARNIYGDGEENYERYLRDYMARFPSHRGALAERFRSGKDNTYKLAGKTYIASDSSLKPLYPAAEYCAAVGYDSEGLEVGNWYLPSIYEIFKIWSKLTYGLAGVSRQNSDAVNRSLYAIGGSAISLGGIAWSSCRYQPNYAWQYSFAGCASISGNSIINLAVPCMLLDLSESEV